MKLGIIGGGRAAWAFGSGWRQAGLPLAGVSVRAGSRSDLPRRLDAPALGPHELARLADLVLLALPDAALEAIAPEIAATPGTSLCFHPSGSLSSAVFGSERGFSLHPLRSLVPVGEPVDLAGTLFVFEGPGETRAAARQIAEHLGGAFAEVPREGKALYHASAVLGSNGVAALLEASADLFARCGLEGAPMRRAIAALAHSAVANWESSPEKFTGPVMRGERGLVQRHLDALSHADPDRAELYRRLAIEIAEAVRKQGSDSAELTEIISLLRRSPLS